MKKAFTLIELLVVVLIIGILSAIALPQYTRAVEKSRIAEAMNILDSLRTAVDFYVLENGYKRGNLLAGDYGEHKNLLMIDVENPLNCIEDYCCSKTFCYYASCRDDDNRCWVSARRFEVGKSSGDPDGDYEYKLEWALSNGKWTKSCDDNSMHGKYNYICFVFDENYHFSSY